MKKKIRLPISFKLSLMSMITITITGVSLGVFLSNTFKQTAHESASNTLNSVSTNASIALEESIVASETAMKLLVNQIGYNYDFANNIEFVSSSTESAKKVKDALAGTNGVGDGSTIIGAMDYLIVSDKDIESATMYSPFVTTPILSRLYPTSSSKIECTKDRYNTLKAHPGLAQWYFKGDNELYVWKALVNYGVQDTYDMKVVGYIEYGFNRTSFLASLTDTKYENEGMMLFDENNKLIMSVSSGLSNIDNIVKTDYKKYENGITGFNDYTVSKKEISNRGWTYISFINHRSLEETTFLSTWLTIAVVTGAIIIGIILSIILSRSTITRIRNLSKAAASISGGDYDTRIAIKSNDEITDVSVTFNSMAKQIQDALNELILQQDSISENFATILSNKSGESGNHVKRVGEYSAILASELGFSESEVHDIRIASMLHDVGKIMVDENILHKPGRFTDEEYKIMQQHVVYGGQLLKGVPGNIMQLGAIIAEYHHERYDGNGYCAHLVGEDIPKEAQITSVADVFDALVSKRCYKGAWSIEDAFNEIVAQKGKQFGPDVVDAFVKRFEDFKRVAEEYKEE